MVHIYDLRSKHVESSIDLKIKLLSNCCQETAPLKTVTNVQIDETVVLFSVSRGKINHSQHLLVSPISIIYLSIT